MWQTNHPRPPSEYNGTAIDDLRAWATITERIYLWDCEIVILSRFVALSVSLTQKSITISDSTNFNNLAQPFPNWYTL